MHVLITKPVSSRLDAWPYYLLGWRYLIFSLAGNWLFSPQLSQVPLLSIDRQGQSKENGHMKKAIFFGCRDIRTAFFVWLSLWEWRRGAKRGRYSANQQFNKSHLRFPSLRKLKPFRSKNAIRAEQMANVQSDLPHSVTFCNYLRGLSWLDTQSWNLSPSFPLQAYVTWFAVSNFFVPFAVLLFCYRWESDIREWIWGYVWHKVAVLMEF